MPLTLLDIQELAKNRGGLCLSTEYINSQAKLRFQCREGHQWDTVPNSVKRGHWCGVCASKTQKGTIEEMQTMAKQRGGTCLSTEYIGANAKLTWQCKEGHQWETNPALIKQGHWCPACVSKQKGTIGEMQKIAQKRGGLCLSTEYINSNSNLTWQCKEGHQWQAVPHNIKRGKWCPVCAGVQIGTIEEMNEMVKCRGGRCYQKNIISNRTALTWQCKEGHQWQAPFVRIKQGKWCPVCAGIQVGTIEEMQEIAGSKDGKCLSKEYINSGTKLTFQCKNDHIWQTTPANIKREAGAPCVPVYR